ncbi:MAG: iron chelate uptake ABC transporter family permease subunit [Bacillota bacterium]|jgi:iron complex transport system permease protein
MIRFKHRAAYRGLFLIGCGLLVVLIVAAANLGVARISFGQTLEIIFQKIFRLGRGTLPDHFDRTAQLIIVNLRLPRICLAGLLGAGLAAAGVVFQAIFRNPMAEPYVLGISSGAALGASCAMVFGLETAWAGFGWLTLAAFGGGLLTIFLVYRIAAKGGKAHDVTLLLAGVALNFLLNALISLIMTFRREQLERIVMWTMGSVATANWREVGLVLPVVGLSLVAIGGFARDLNVLVTGDDSAQSLGIEVARVKKTLLVISTLLVATLVSVSGVIGFVGLIVPHMTRLVFGPDHRVVLPFAALGGAILLIVGDTLARTAVPPSEIPLGVITAIFGVPFFLYLIAAAKRKGC